MSLYHLGEFEEIVLLTIAILQNDAYGVSIVNEMETRLGRSVSIGALQTVLKRLEQKNLLTSRLGEATKVRGGKRKRFFTITLEGQKILKQTKDQRLSLWTAIPNTAKFA